MKKLLMELISLRFCVGVALASICSSVLAQQVGKVDTPSGLQLRDEIVHVIRFKDNPEALDLDGVVKFRATISYVEGYYHAAFMSKVITCPKNYNSSDEDETVFDMISKINNWINSNPESLSLDRILIMWLALDIDSICPK